MLQGGGATQCFCRTNAIRAFVAILPHQSRYCRFGCFGWQ